jgi:hypothetical protein
MLTKNLWEHVDLSTTKLDINVNFEKTLSFVVVINYLILQHGNNF